MNLENFAKRFVRLTNQEDIEGYILRENEALPSTPRIYVGTKTQKILTIYLQKFKETFNLEGWKKLPMLKLLDYFEIITKGFITLKRKFGCFTINQNLIRLNFNNCVKVWINEDAILNYRQNPLYNNPKNENIMVKQLTKLFNPLLSQLQSAECYETFQSLLQDIRDIKEKNNLNLLKIQQSANPKSNIIKSFQLSQSPQVSYRNSIYSVYQNKNKSHFKSNKNISTSFLSPSSTKLSKFQGQKPHNHLQKLKHSILQKKISCYFTENVEYKRSMNIQQQINFVKQPTVIVQTSKLQNKQIQNDKQFHNLQRQRKFPNTTSSTFVTLKETKNHLQIFENIDQSISILRKSRDIRQRTVTRSKEDIENQLENLFFGDNHTQLAVQQQNYYDRRQAEFQELFTDF